MLVLASCTSDAVELMPDEQCAVEVFRARGLEGDECMADCIESGEGRSVGGGCYHLCFAYSDLEWPEAPAGLDSCYAPADSL